MRFTFRGKKRIPISTHAVLRWAITVQREAVSRRPNKSPVIGVIMMSVTDMVSTVSIVALASAAASLLIVVTQGWHGKLSLDNDVAGIQKFHKTPVPRIGGVAVMIGIVSALIASNFGFVVGLHPYGEDMSKLSMLVLAAMPAFLTGVIEDLTKRVSVTTRLLATFASALLAAWLLEAYLTRLDTWGVDTLLAASPLLAIVITIIAVGGVANAINIIDGFHGVAGSAVVIMLAGLGFLAWRADDAFVTSLALLGVGATLGFLAINYPTGRLFMGDGGAYLLGFWLAEVAVLLVIRNPRISTWQVLAVCSYPVIEVLYTMYRRKVIRKTSPGSPDRLHLHTLIYRRVVCQHLPRNDDRPWIRNAAVAWFVGSWIATVTLINVLLGNTMATAVSGLVVHVILYITVYTRLVRGRWYLKPVFAVGVVRSRPAIRELP